MARPEVLLWSLVLGSCCQGTVDGYSSRAGSCSSPGHGSESASAVNSISAPSSASPSSLVTVTLAGSGYKGFLLKSSGGGT
eukprot:SAG22_NODE_15397_length_349_cov_1.440000_1_plen_80_part_10